MLTHLHIQDFTLVDQLDIELHEGLTTITGETGAGKSMMLDALGLTLGDRTDASKVRQGTKRAEITASFDTSRLKFASKWLKDNDIPSEGECILRRVITSEGRSRAYINGQTVTLQQLKTLGEMLVDIHSQHEHQSLLSTHTHRRLLDDFGKAQALASQVKDAYREWRETADALAQSQKSGDELNARYQLLRYQVEELDTLDLTPGELEQLEEEQSLLSHMAQTQASCQQVIDICDSDGVGLQDRIHHALQLIDDIPNKPQDLDDICKLLEQANINIAEAKSDVERFVDTNEENPERLFEVNERLNSIYEIARKHHIDPEALVSHHQSLAEELNGMRSGDDMTEQLTAELAEKRDAYDKLATKLSKTRQQTAKSLAKAVNGKLAQLAMERAQFSVQLSASEEEPQKHGNESIEFLISTNPGQPPQSLQKVASGGELSRVSLAIQVVTAETSTTPTLVFDEVDVGIGGTTGDVVGHLLSELGRKGQIFCVTHLAQVASKAHHHLRADKQVSKKGATTTLTTIEGDEKIIEISRMMGGVVDSKQSLAHAKQMLETAS